MDAFSYLSVMISLILGLAITQVLQGFRGLMQARSRLAGYWPSVVWALLIVVISVQGWWSMFGLRLHVDWTFLEFSAVLAQTVVLYLLAALVLPDAHGDAAVDLRAYYEGQRRWFFSLLVILIVASLGKSLILEAQLPRPADLAFHGLFALLGASGALIASRRYHAVLAIAGVVAISAYIALLFMHLAQPVGR
jgi:hypothetical protein